MLEDFFSTLERLFYASRFFGLGISFIAGILASLSGCVYPLIPVTLGIIGITPSVSFFKALGLSLSFSLGIAFLYTVLGIVAGVLGILLSNFFLHPLTYLFLSLVFFLLGFFNLGLVRINLSFSLPQISSKKNFRILFLLGMLSALASFPCNFGILGAILTLISLKKDFLYGGLALFFFSLGYCLLIFILAFVFSLIKRLPKFTAGIIIVKRLASVLLLGMGVYFLGRFLEVR